MPPEARAPGGGRRAALLLSGLTAIALAAAASLHASGGLPGPVGVVVPLLLLGVVAQGILLAMGVRRHRPRRQAYGLLTLALAGMTANVVLAQRARHEGTKAALADSAERRRDQAIDQLDIQLGVLPELAREVGATVAGPSRTVPAFREAAGQDMHWLIDTVINGPAAGAGRQRSATLSSPRINQIGVALPPEVSWDHHRHGAYAHWIDGAVQLDDLLHDLDYDFTTDPHQGAWYQRALKDGPGWSDPPYYDAATRAVLIEYTAPMYLPDHTFVGVSYASFSLAKLTDFIKGLDLGDGGYAFVVSRGGVIASYPAAEYAQGTTTIDQFASQRGDPGLTAVAHWVDSRPDADLEARWLRDPMTGQDAITACGVLSDSKWALCTVMLPTGHTTTADSTLDLTAVWVGVVAALLALLLDPAGTRPIRLWLFSAGVSITFAVGIASAWRAALDAIQTEGSVIFADSQVARFVAKEKTRTDPGRSGEALSAVPTGLMLTEVTPQSDGVVRLAGLYWQDLTPLSGEDDTLPPSAGLRVANALEWDQELAFQRRVDGKIAAGWRFRCAVPVQMDDAWYPIAQQNIVLEMQPSTLASGALLVPDIDAYELILPAALPGVSPAVAPPGWTPYQSGFAFIDREWRADFGLGQENLGRRLSALGFRLSMNLDLLNPLITYLLPITILSILMFALLMVTSIHPERAHRLGLTATAGISTYGTLFFIAVLEHISLRQALAASHMVYFEWFFIVIYLGLLALTLNTLLVAAMRPLDVVRYGDNLMAKVLYWPLLTGSLLVITLCSFYR